MTAATIAPVLLEDGEAEMIKLLLTFQNYTVCLSAKSAQIQMFCLSLRFSISYSVFHEVTVNLLYKLILLLYPEFNLQ